MDNSVLVQTAVMVVVVMAALGTVFGFILAYANKRFAVEVNPLVHAVEDILPKGQCGACGYPGCMAYAEAVVSDPNVAPDLCIPGKAEVAKKVAQLTNKAVVEKESRIAQVRCAGSKTAAGRSYEYEGIEDCTAANLLAGGPKACKYGCIGFGTCVKSCPFNAMAMSEEGLPVIDKKKCTGCGSCETACPKKIIALVPEDSHVLVRCSSKDKGAVSRKLCTISCIGCGLCARTCPYAAITVENNLAFVNSSVCIEKCSAPVCLAKCPTKAITAY